MPKPKCDYLLIKSIGGKVWCERLASEETLEKPKPRATSGKANMSLRLGKGSFLFGRETLSSETYLQIRLTKVIRKTPRSARHRRLIDSSQERASYFRFSSNAKRNW